MDSVRLHDKVFRLSIPHEKIAQSIKELAGRINADYTGKPAPLFIGVLNGVFMFASELLQEIRIDCEISFVKLASYEGTDSSGKISRLIGLSENIAGRDVIVLEDVIDSGRTITSIYDELKRQNPSSIKFAAMFFKPDAYKGDIPVDYYAIETPNDFIIGFGMDYDGLGRNLRDIYTLYEETK